MSIAFEFAEQSARDAPVKARKRRRDAAPGTNRRAKLTNNPFAAFDRNTARGRRLTDLVRGYLNGLGNPTDVALQAQVIAAAELQVLAEETRSAALQSPATADLDNLVRVQSVADRAVRRLGLRPKDMPQQSFRDRLLTGRAT
jgi:hypothetical protein